MGPKSEDMRMFPLESEDEANSFPLSKWKIPEPSRELVLSREDGAVSGDIDLIVVPGVAFDARCNRLGHGRGYYGKRCLGLRGGIPAVERTPWLEADATRSAPGLILAGRNYRGRIRSHLRGIS